MAHKTISGAVVAGCGDYQTVGNHSRPMQSAVAVNADTLAPHSLCTAPCCVATTSIKENAKSLGFRAMIY